MVGVACVFWKKMVVLASTIYIFVIKWCLQSKAGELSGDITTFLPRFFRVSNSNIEIFFLQIWVTTLHMRGRASCEEELCSRKDIGGRWVTGRWSKLTTTLGFQGMGVECLSRCLQVLEVVLWLIFLMLLVDGTRSRFKKTSFLLMHKSFFKSRDQGADTMMSSSRDLDNKWVFLVKSAYFLGLKLANLNVASSLEGIASKTMWQYLWKSKASQG